MVLQLNKSVLSSGNTIQITGSKSESNRVLLLQSLFDNIQIENCSNADDSLVLKKALWQNTKTVDVHHAGTAMRFLTAFYAIQKERETILTGSSRMKERPIKVLVEALQSLGAEINYLENAGYPPLYIKGGELKGASVKLQANVSSQYISALLLIAPVLKNGLVVSLIGEVTSVPYIKMTLSLLSKVGVVTSFEGSVITVAPIVNTKKQLQKIVIESDWSSASYYYSCIALSSLGATIKLSSYKKDSLQGDACLSELYKHLGVSTKFEEHSIILTKTAHAQEEVSFNLINSPDIAQTIAVSCFGLGIACNLIGLHTLKIKETDRLVALKVELEKFGAQVSISNDSLFVNKSKIIKEGVVIDTYQDHRMAMAFAPLALKTSFYINNPEVVTKSYPDFWEDLKSVGFQTLKI